ncbi:SDR family oxidoreductase [Sphingomonas sp. RIT328]|uniref:SDR family oxidoreductase n=1 Tax=Sphingomonas sp. RIT328 TaxID=1470591 RepID=UPI000445968E|nr:SDR family oxidoreductase [Sphingomonas sp. RIT328]EZP54802.1 Short chain dehydrogenase family protein [Sphingomonas sp. RIT328]
MLSRTVLVTGGAKRLGAAIARACAAAGWRVVVHCHGSTEAGQALAGELGGTMVQGDLADAAVVDTLIAQAREAAGGAITALVNSASLFAFDRPEAIDPALATRLHSINAVAPARLAAALAAQPDVEDAAVVNLLDQKLANPNPDFFSYTMSKYALSGATEMLAQALAPKVRVNAVAPGITLPSGDQSEAEFAAVASDNLLRHPVGADAVAAAVVYLLDARSVTGQTLYVDCGQRFIRRDGDVMFAGRHG